MTGLILIGLGKSAVDDQQLAAALDRRLPFLALHRHMPVDDMGMLYVQPEELREMIHQLEELLQAYRDGTIIER